MSILNRLIEAFRNSGGQIYEEGEVAGLDNHFVPKNYDAAFGIYTPHPSIPLPLNNLGLPDERFKVKHCLIWIGRGTSRNRNKLMGHELGHWIDEINGLGPRHSILPVHLEEIKRLRAELFFSKDDNNHFSQPKEIWAELVSCRIEERDAISRDSEAANTNFNNTSQTNYLSASVNGSLELKMKREIQIEIDRYIDKLI